MELLEQINEIVAMVSAVIGFITGWFSKRNPKDPPEKPQLKNHSFIS